MADDEDTTEEHGNDWVEGAIKHPGALRATAESEGALTDDGKIKRGWLEQKASEDSTTGRRARLALQMRGWKRG